MNKRAFLVFVAALVLIPFSVCAQQSLSIIDALPPYDLTATLLANGHFSVSTRYTGEPKTLIYREDGTGGRPVNYTSHVHFKVDDVIFQLPYELNPATREAPPDNPLSIAGLFRDTVAGRPRVNARMFGVMPDGDTVRFVFTMQPVKRPSGGFIRFSAEVDNSTGKQRSVGVLMLIDTQIGSNDRAPIVSAFGYQNTETQYTGAAAPGMPAFWLALEGSPANPQLTARGNLRESELIEPDIFLFGNWVDYTALGIPGLALAQWKERAPSGLEYTDSAVLLVWDEEEMPAGQRRLRASTEIGIVDSLKVQFSPGTVPYDVALAGAGTCLMYETVEENPCGDPEYHPYLPDSLQTLYIVTNRGAQTMSDVRVVVPQIPTGLSAAAGANPVIPTDLGTGVTGVATVTFYAAPRLQTATCEVPVAVMTGADTVMFDTVCVIVPGLLGEIDVRDARFLPLCPGREDTIDIVVKLDGVRCLQIEDLRLVGTQPGSDLFALVPPLPTVVPANGEVRVRVRYFPDALGNHATKLAVAVRDFETFTPGDTTFVVLRDTADITGVGRDAAFFFASETDTLDLGAVCVGDTVEGEWEIVNVGGCDLVIDRAFAEGGVPGQFLIGNESSLPVTIPRGERYTVNILFAPVVQGDDNAMAIVAGAAQPSLDTLFLRGRGDIPHYTVPTAPLNFDTLCPGSAYSRAVELRNPTACPVVIDSLAASLAEVGIVPTGRFVIPPFGSVTAQVRASFAVSGDYTGTITAHSAAGVRPVALLAVVRDRAVLAPVSVDFGDVRLGANSTATLTLTAAGTPQTHAEVMIDNVRIAGVNGSEYTLGIPPGAFPRRLMPGESLSLSVGFVPGDLEQRRAAVLVDIVQGTVCGSVQPVELFGRGILPVIDIPRRTIDFGRVCVGQTVDTVIVVRNLGNAPLHVRGVSTEGSSDIAVLGGDLPVTVDEDSTKLVRIRFAPQRLGEVTTELYMQSDGAWFTAPDTMVRLTGTGIICAEVWVDTLHLATGSVAEIPVRIRPAAGVPLQPSDISRLMNESGHTSLSFSVSHGPKLFRFRNEAVPDGMLQSSPVVSQPGRVAVSVGNAFALRSGDVLAVLRGDVLLGDRFESELHLEVSDFADGYARIAQRHGLLVSEYCALDRRYVNTSGVRSFVQPRQTPIATGGVLDMYIAQAGMARLVLVDAMGRHVAVLFSGEVARGSHEILIGGFPLPSGVYTAVLETAGEKSAVPVLVVE